MTRLLLACLALFLPMLANGEPLKLPAADQLREELKTLKPGQYLWYPEVSPQGPITLVVSLTEQRAYIYRNGIVIGVTTVSTGRPGKDTPTGVFTILQKSVSHRSTLYNSAPMPYMQRLTWDGVALHAGSLPGYPSSHGCVHLPLEFAKKLYEITGFGSTTVVITDSHSAPSEVNHPGLLAPLVADGKPAGEPQVAGNAYLNDPGSDHGPLSILISRADLRVYVFRGGELIGSAPVLASGTQLPHGMAVFSLLQKPPASEFDPAPPLRWSAVALSDPQAGGTPADQLGHVSVDKDFLRQLHDAMDIGTTLVITDLSASRETRSDGQMTVINTEPEETAPPVKK